MNDEFINKPCKSCGKYAVFKIEHRLYCRHCGWTNQQRNLPFGRKLRDEGIDTVTTNAGPWSAQAGAAARAYIDALPVGTRFCGEDVRLDGMCELPRPHSPKAYGGVMGPVLRAALKAQTIRRDGLKQAQDPKAHARMYPAYLRVERW